MFVGLGLALFCGCDGGTSSGASGAPAAAGLVRETDLEARLAAAEALARELEVRLEVERARASELATKLAAESARLTESEARRLDREREWLDYQMLLARLDKSRLPGGEPFRAELPEAESLAARSAAEGDDPNARDPGVREPESEEMARTRQRSLAIAASLRALFSVEQVRGLELVECGTLAGDAIGPVVVRLFDGERRPAGSLFAERLRLEGSRAGRTLTLVLENGYETRGGERLPFEGAPSALDGAGGTSTAIVEGRLGGLRRIVVDHVDPTRWADDLAELFGERGLDRSGDDGLWDLGVVRVRLNERLGRETVGGVWRLRELGGVDAGVLLSVHLEKLDASGKVERRLFADRLRIARGPGAGDAQGVELTLESGVQVRGDAERVPFLDGRFRIVLPGADPEAWKAAGVPGLSEPPSRD